MVSGAKSLSESAGGGSSPVKSAKSSCFIGLTDATVSDFKAGSAKGDFSAGAVALAVAAADAGAASGEGLTADAVLAVAVVVGVGAFAGCDAGIADIRRSKPTSSEVRVSDDQRSSPCKADNSRTNSRSALVSVRLATSFNRFSWTLVTCSKSPGSGVTDTISKLRQ